MYNLYNMQSTYPGMTNDGHGGRSEEHRREMEEIARKVFAEERAALMEEIQEQFYLAYQQAIEDFLHALQYDIESVVQIGIDGCRDIFEDKKAQKYISDHILQEIMKRLKDKNLRK
jgi:hypothetical protein